MEGVCAAEHELGVSSGGVEFEEVAVDVASLELEGGFYGLLRLLFRVGRRLGLSAR